ncbi:MAG TPA: hypothetical protein PLJ25_05720, partial [Methanothrix sp.]|nr:hypothetical protein [Methanothrix sp.]
VEGKPDHGGNVTANATASVQAQEAKISVTKTADPTFGSPSTDITFNLVVKNTGNTNLTSVFVSDLLPVGMSYRSSDGGVNNGRYVNWSNIGRLAPEESIPLQIVAHIDGPFVGLVTLTNRVDVEGKPDHGSNVTDYDTATVQAQEAKISVTKTADPTFGSPGTNVTFTLVAKNTGNANLTNVFVSDLLPMGMSYRSSNCGTRKPIYQLVQHRPSGSRRVEIPANRGPNRRSSRRPGYSDQSG